MGTAHEKVSAQKVFPIIKKFVPVRNISDIYIIERGDR